MLTKDERRVVDILVGCGVVANLDTQPIQAVAEGMQWGTSKAEEFVYDLFARKIVKREDLGRVGSEYNPRWRWVEVKIP